jgi:hypothetical protein
MIGIQADEGLQQRSSKLESQRNQSDLAKVELKRILQNGIDRRNKRLNGVVEQMREAGCHQNQ